MLKNNFFVIMNIKQVTMAIVNREETFEVFESSAWPHVHLSTTHGEGFTLSF